MAKETQEGLTVKKEENFTEWFTQLMLKAEVADYSSVSGSIVYRPVGYALWEKIKEETDKEFKKIGLQNAYFPLFIPESSFGKESEFVKGFAPEVAWVTHGGNTKLGERLAVRPTSEAIMYESYSKWIRSHRDLPLLINLWNNVVRWEFNNPVPFFRGREFLWCEVHTAFSTEKEAIDHGRSVMRAFNKVTEKIMGIPGIYGRKTNMEKFAGAVFSEKVHTYLPNGRVLEGTCFHHDGQNFAKAYDIKFQTKDEKEEYVWQNTHAISTRMLGGMLALHSDNNGLVIPPKIAPNKVVIIPLLFKGKEEIVLDKAQQIFSELKKFNPILDDREDVSPGWKFNEWELKGIPIRIEIGPRDIDNKEVIVKVRINEEKKPVSFATLTKQIPKMLDEMQEELYKRASLLLYDNLTETESLEELKKLVGEKKVVAVPICSNESCEEKIKTDIGGAKSLWVDEKKSVRGRKCVCCGQDAVSNLFFGRTY